METVPEWPDPPFSVLVMQYSYEGSGLVHETRLADSLVSD